MSRDIPTLMEDAAERGFSNHFEFLPDRLFCRETRTSYLKDRLKLIDMLQPDPGSDPGGEATLYLLQAADGEKGMLLIGNHVALSAEERDVLARICNAGQSTRN